MDQVEPGTLLFTLAALSESAARARWECWSASDPQARKERGLAPWCYCDEKIAALGPMVDPEGKVVA